MQTILAPATRLWLRLRLNEIGPLVSLAGCGFFAWAFIALAGEVFEGETHAFDTAILLALRSPQNLADPLGPGWLEESARDITGLGGYAILTLVTASSVIYLLMAGKRGAAALVAVAVVGGALLSTGLKLGFERPRPELVPHATQVYTASFPSGHAMLSAVTYLTLGALLSRVQERRRIKAFIMGLAVAATLLVGASRIYLGVHWPSDVLGGWTVGAAWASLCWFVALQLQRGGQVEKPGESTAPP
ncbi:phosphatase PAP2 family protein [Microvirga thermotolerans]|uniref:Phosphatase PAP2 family protein n=1 Tax=Microvirga thermotolerans TaxID=2651334 RepID=A0A5P9JRB3_9HYPH|nr:phosphatase PAP2 family protein [Microvirga thermotolerans]QFU14903.1 phosphatase PAP2 family protein [Microvirga thermotolerans]